MVNKTRQETKNDYLEWQYQMLECAMSCIRCYKITKNEKFFELYQELKKEADKWEHEADSLHAL